MKYWTTKETWKEVFDYEGLYEVSDLGNVRSLRNERKKKRHKGVG